MRRWLAAASVLLALACSKSSVISEAQLESEAKAARSLGAEMALLQRIEQNGHATRTFYRAHVLYLRQSLREHLKKLARSSAEPGNEAELDRVRWTFEALLVRMP